ncbi:MAG TPA: hypothetical protein IAB00_06195 [Candidatus Avidehalobacter gallistercoris]|uniref:Uncharacterized protein n=1 Tax=Candidatus Avidehalobacter gallistercoris TaxID=2840694 RepID=A0A9D1HKN7_9FIRM|nr:hypothetical protein [Candidatus Avidehalobacter gallistercoris]
MKRQRMISKIRAALLAKFAVASISGGKYGKVCNGLVIISLILASLVALLQFLIFLFIKQSFFIEADRLTGVKYIKSEPLQVRILCIGGR